METDLIFGAEADDVLFGTALETQLAAASTEAAPFEDALPRPFDAAKVVIPEGQTVVRVPVTPGEIVELPFGPDAQILAKEGDGNLAIKVGDVVVILEGYVGTAPAPVIETADGKPLDIATLLATTDPNIDIHTAAGPGGNQGGQGADNSGAIFQQLGGEGGLGGFQGAGGQGDSDAPNGGPGVDQAGNTQHQTFVDTNSAPVAKDLAATTDEDHAVSGTLPAKDADGDPLTYSAVGALPAGVTVGKDGAWSFDPTGISDYDKLDTGDHLAVTFQYKANDGQADSNVATVTIDVTGVNDAPEITAGLLGLYPNEDASGSLTVGLSVTDPDDSVFTMSTVGAMPTGVSYDPATDKLSFDLAGHYDYLKPGETTDLVVTFQASDGEATSNGWPVTLTVSGVNDAATITGDKTGTVTEDSGVSATGKLTVTDLDHDESHTELKSDQKASYGTWSVDADGNWSYKLDNTNADVNKLGDKDTLTDKFTVNSLDGTASQEVSITIQGHNDAPTAGSTFIGDQNLNKLTEEFVGATNLAPIVHDAETPSNKLTYSAVTALPTGISLSADGTVTLSLAGNYDYLKAGQEIEVFFQYKAFDGQAYSNIGTVTVPIVGVYDPVVASPDTILTNNGTTQFTLPDWALLANDKNPEGANLSIFSTISDQFDLFLDHSGGTLTFGDLAKLGASFQYSAYDGTTASYASVTLVNQTGGDLHGTAAHEILVGSAASVKIDGGGGKDLIFGGSGDETFIFHDGDIVQGGGDSWGGSGQSILFAPAADVLAIDHSVDFSKLDLTNFGGIETLSTAEAGAGAGSAQSITINASDVAKLSDHTLTLAIFNDDPAINVKLEAVDQLYLSINKTGDGWEQVGFFNGPLAVYAHETIAGDQSTVDAAVIVTAPINANQVQTNVHLET